MFSKFTNYTSFLCILQVNVNLYILFFPFYYLVKFNLCLALIESRHVRYMGRRGKPLLSYKKQCNQYKFITPLVLKELSGL